MPLPINLCKEREPSGSADLKEIHKICSLCSKSSVENKSADAQRMLRLHKAHEIDQATNPVFAPPSFHLSL